MTTTLCETTYPLCMIAGTTFERILILKDSNGTPLDLTGYTAEIHVRAKVTDATPLIDCTVVVTPAEGRIDWAITPAETLALTAVQAGQRISGVWDLRITNDDTSASHVYLPASKFTIQPAATRTIPTPEPTPEPEPEP